MQHNNYSALFSEIINGYSVVKHSFFGNLYLKHFSYADTGEMENIYANFFEEARLNNIPTYKEQEEYIIKENLWTEKDELDILQQESFLSTIRLNYSKEYLNSRRAGVKKTIEDAEVKVNALKLRKDSFISKTAESYANQKSFLHRVSQSFFKDRKLTELINQDIDDDNYEELSKLFYHSNNKLCVENIKKISISTFFINIFHISDNNIYHFYGKPIIELTNYQIDLFSWGKYFKHMMSEHGNFIPSHVQENPDKFMDWIDMRKNAKDARVLGDENDGGSMSIVGANKGDYEILGLQITDNTKLRQKMKEKGGILTKDDLYAIDN